MTVIPRYLAPRVLSALTERRVVCVLGPRQAGKSTLVRSLIDGGHDATYVTLDDPATLEAARSDPMSFLADRRPLAIDEVQRSPELLLAIKRVVDDDQTRGQFLLTGSTNLLTSRRVADALPGRVQYLTLWPFTQGEYAGSRDHAPLLHAFTTDRSTVDFRGAGIGLRAYARRLAAGGFPEAIDAAAASRFSFFAGYVDSILSHAGEEVAVTRTPEALRQVLRLTAARSGALANRASIASDLQIDAKTVAKHLDTLEQLFLIDRLEPWHVNLGHRVVKTPKLHLCDTGLLCALVGADADRLTADPGLGGSVVETFVVEELRRQVSASELAPLLRFHHYRDQRGIEIDLVIEHANGDVVAIEVKSSATPRAADVAGLSFIRDKLGSRFRAGFLVHLGSKALPFGDRIQAIPLEAML